MSRRPVAIASWVREQLVCRVLQRRADELGMLRSALARDVIPDADRAA